MTFAWRSEGGLVRIGDVHTITPQYESVLFFGGAWAESRFFSNPLDKGAMEHHIG